MPSAPHLYEIQLGVYATSDDVRHLAAGCDSLLAGHPWPYRLGVAGPERTAEPGGMPLTEFYDELPRQWRIEHRGADPGSRRVHEIRVGLLAPKERMDAIRAELTRVACPEPEHSSPCPVPWSVGYTEASEDGEDADDGEGGNESAAYLERLYGELRR